MIHSVCSVEDAERLFNWQECDKQSPDVCIWDIVSKG